MPTSKRASAIDTLRLQLRVSVPAFLLGVVAPNRGFVSRAAARDAGRATFGFLRELRERYGDHVSTWFPLRRTLVVFDPATIEAVLDSDANAADPLLKKLAVSRFAPDALVISSDPEWRDRRTFNQRALDTGCPHRHADAFAAIATAEAGRVAPDDGVLRWPDFEALAERISNQVLLGARRDELELSRHIGKMVRRANFLLMHHTSFAAFYARIRSLAAAKPGAASPPCLVNDAATLANDGTATDITEVPSQIGFWFFVLKDAVELHVARTLAMIAAHPDVQRRVRDEVRRADPLNARAIEGFRLLEACIEEQLRLWTPVPLLLRRAMKTFSPRDGLTVRAGQQILIPAGFYHRDARAFGDLADRFSPDAAAADGFPTVYAFSRHRQSCAGRSLVLFVLKATLASLLARWRFELVGPAIDAGRVPYLYDHSAIELRAAAADA